VKHKVWVYLWRRRETGPELLVFEHADTDAGIQIPAGTVEPNEEYEKAARRELEEESGVVARGAFASIGVLQRVFDGELISAHLFAVPNADESRDSWVHRVTGKGEDEGMQFRFFWLACADWNELWGDFQRGCPLLEEFITQTTNAEPT
jgi:8-oxo-dGTP pyrophosphatase MutT (NUDIX family)